MIYFATPEDGRFSVDIYLGNEWGRPLAGRLQPVTYESLCGAPALDAGTWIFTGLDQLTASGLDFVRHAADRLAHAGLRSLNHPDRALLRKALLDKLYEAGTNSFRAFTCGAPHPELHFPVFVRESNKHNGALTPLLGSRAELRNALAALRLRGYRMDDLLTVEFCDCSKDGLFRKYSAYYLCGEVLPRHLQVSREWMVKSKQGLLDDRYAFEEFRYIEKNPHREFIRRIFEITGIEYGRIDYGVLDGRPQVWEINTNPSLTWGRSGGRGRSPEVERFRELQRPGKQLFHAAFHRAVEGIDTGGASYPPVALNLPHSFYRTWQAELQRKARAGDRRAMLRRLSEFPMLRALRPVLEPAARRLLGKLS